MPNRRETRKSYRISFTDDQTHMLLWSWQLRKRWLVVSIISVLLVILTCSYILFAYTPLKTLIPGYPDAETQRTAMRNAIVLDSLENAINRWEYYSENLKRVILGEDPVRIDSLVRSKGGLAELKARATEVQGQDSLLRQQVSEAGRFSLSGSHKEDNTIESMHFFVPLKGVVTNGFEEVFHPYIDVVAPENSVVMSVLDGTVISSGWSDEGGYSIQVQHSNDIVSIYMHNQKLLKKTGDKVRAGSPIAIVGNTGSLATGDHLHFELWHKGEAVDPTKYISF